MSSTILSNDMLIKNFLRKGSIFLQDPVKIPHYFRYIITKFISGHGISRIPLGGRIKASTFSEYLSVYGLMPTQGEVNMLSMFMDNAKHVFDIGANIGVWSVLMTKLNQDAVIHSFEPNLNIFSLLKRNIKENRCPKVVLNNVAVSNSEDELEFQVPKNASIFGRVSPNGDARDDEGRFDNSTTFTIPSMSLSHYCRKHAIDQIDFLKIDIEGHELAAFQGFEEMLRYQRIKAIYMETIEANFIRMGVSYRALLEFIDSCGYQFFAINPDGTCSEALPLDKIRAHNHLCLPKAIGEI
ncbi:MAG: FkbM family methyltransferase [Cyanothece sp. SIO1E1]|nr:FkbM family methyltransferase [Cyanothece sp. SIO1E1]